VVCSILEKRPGCLTIALALTDPHACNQEAHAPNEEPPKGQTKAIDEGNCRLAAPARSLDRGEENCRACSPLKTSNRHSGL